MIVSTQSVFIAGLLAMGFAVVGVFFLKFWRRTQEGLFGAFAFAFWLMALGQATTALLGAPEERQAVVYLPRLAAFVLILGAILRKNLAGRR